jgi:hypothetical protein
LLRVVALGSVISPLSLGLYLAFLLAPPLGFFTGIFGLVSSLFREAPGYDFASWLGVVRPSEIVSGMRSVYVELPNGVFWAAVYGIVGFIVDWLPFTRSRRVS